MQRPLLPMRGKPLWRSSANGSVNRFRSGAGIQMISKHLRNTSAMLSSPRCGAGTRSGNRAGLRGKRQTTLPNAWWCAGIRRSARQQERDEAWALYSRSYRGTPKNEGFPGPVRQQLQAIG